MEIGVLFDLDGVLIDSESVYTKFWDDMNRMFPTGIDNFALKIKGSTLPSILNTYFPDPSTQAQIHKLIKDFEATMEYKPFPEAIRFVEDIKDAGIRHAIVTSSSQKKMDTVYLQNPGFKELFDAIVTGDMVTHSKPNPEPYLIGAKSINVDIRNCFVFEDSLSGIKAGMDSGATTIAMATTLPMAQLKGKAHKIINDFTGFNISDMLSAKHF